MLKSLAGLALAASLALGPGDAAAGPVLDRVRAAGVLRVCIWPAYYGVTHRNPRTGQLTGIDIELSADFAHDLQLRLEYVDSTFATLITDLKTDRCDIAMFAVAMLEQRQAQLDFSRPYLQSDIYGVAARASRVVRDWADIDKPGVRVAVQAGTFMEPVMAGWLKHATLVVVKSPATREQELEAGRVDVFMTDYAYSRRLLDYAEWAGLVPPPAPFHVLPYGYAVKQGDSAWLGLVDQFVARIKRDGRLEAAAARAGLSAMVVRQP